MRMHGTKIWHSWPKFSLNFKNLNEMNTWKWCSAVAQRVPHSSGSLFAHSVDYEHKEVAAAVDCGDECCCYGQHVLVGSANAVGDDSAGDCCSLHVDKDDRRHRHSDDCCDDSADCEADDDFGFDAAVAALYRF